MEKKYVGLYSLGVGVVIILVVNTILGQDPALHLAQQLGLGNGIILGGLLGGITGLYLTFGGRKRITSFGGIIIGIVLGVLFYQWAKPHAWIIEAILVGAFGENGKLYTPLASIMLLFLVIRVVADLGQTGLTRLLEWTDTRQQHKQLVREAVVAATVETE